jgi:glutamine amidotransferase
VVFASERMDDDPRWRLVTPGELVHVDSALQITSDVVLPDPPRHQLRSADLNATAQAAQHTAAT